MVVWRMMTAEFSIKIIHVSSWPAPASRVMKLNSQQRYNMCSWNWLWKCLALSSTSIDVASKRFFLKTTAVGSTFVTLRNVKNGIFWTFLILKIKKTKQMHHEEACGIIIRPLNMDDTGSSDEIIGESRILQRFRDNAKTLVDKLEKSTQHELI